MFASAINWLRGMSYRRNYYLSRLRQPAVPPRPLSYLPDGFRIERIASTGQSLIEGFLSADECARARSAAGSSSASEAVVSDWAQFPKDAVAWSVVLRVAMLAGRSWRQALPPRLISLGPGQEYSIAGSPAAEHYLIFLDADGAALRLPALGVGIEAAPGRAVPLHPELLGETPASVVAGESPCCVLHIELDSSARTSAAVPVERPPQVETGQPLAAGDHVPLEGVAYLDVDSEDSLFSDMLNGQQEK